MVQKITAEELKKKLDAGESVHLIDALSAKSFNARHIPGAKNVPYTPSFISDFEKKVGAQKNEEIIVYCASSGCQLSVLAADALEEADYGNVAHFEDGLAGWQNAGYTFKET